MKISRFWLAGIALAVSGSCLAETEYAAERYAVILDRSPFGADPLTDVEMINTAKEKADAAAAAAAAKELRLCFLFESESGEVRAGFQNLKAKPGDSKSIILMVGESFLGMKLLEIDLAGSEATMLNNGKPLVFELSKAPVTAKAPAKKPAQRQRKFGGGFRPKPPPKKQAKPPEPKLSPEEQRLRREEIRANLQDYQMEVIRSGMPPLPIPLTQDMDDQLVAEGVLPPEE